MNLGAFVSDFDAVVNVHKKKESSVFNDDTEYKKCLNEVKFCPRLFACARVQTAGPSKIEESSDFEVLPLRPPSHPSSSLINPITEM